MEQVGAQRFPVLIALLSGNPIGLTLRMLACLQNLFTGWKGALKLTHTYP